MDDSFYCNQDYLGNGLHFKSPIYVLDTNLFFSENNFVDWFLLAHIIITAIDGNLYRLFLQSETIFLCELPYKTNVYWTCCSFFCRNISRRNRLNRNLKVTFLLTLIKAYQVGQILNTTASWWLGDAQLEIWTIETVSFGTKFKKFSRDLVSYMENCVPVDFSLWIRKILSLEYIHQGMYTWEF